MFVNRAFTYFSDKTSLKVTTSFLKSFSITFIYSWLSVREKTPKQAWKLYFFTKYFLETYAEHLPRSSYNRILNLWSSDFFLKSFLGPTNEKQWKRKGFSLTALKEQKRVSCIFYKLSLAVALFVKNLLLVQHLQWKTSANYDSIFSPTLEVNLFVTTKNS